MSRALLACLLVLLALPAASASARVEIGVSDQKPATFADARFVGLNITEARLVVGWDAMDSPAQVDQIATWLDAARAAGVEQPLIAFTRSRTPGRGAVLPTSADFARHLRSFRARWPQLRTFSVWNEPNLSTQLTVHRIPLVVRWYRALRHACPRCRLLAGELIDMGNMVSWAERFERRLGRHPAIWGLHNYRDVNRMTTRTTSALLRTTHAKIWLTETGGIVGRRNRPSHSFPQTPAHAAKATRWLFERIVPLSRRITRVYLYHWSAVERNARWDSALIASNGRARPALAVLERQLERLR
jgi:hypothetical protein